MGDAPIEPPSDISRALYAVRAGKLMDVVDRIADIKGELKELELPRIAVIGKQSAGKSSLIEAMARIDVPRGSGTCTRCPTEIRLRKSVDPWKCSITLKLDYDEHGNRSEDNIEPIAFGEPFFDRTQVEKMLRRAQLAVLNPDNHPRLYLNIDPETCMIPDAQHKFSKNVICIEVCGPDLADLTLVDLPGMIQNDASHGNLDRMIRAMVREYISPKSTLILVAVTMNDDLENQAALKEARDVDPEGARTIGVLTKPDTVQDGDEHMWIPLLKNEGLHALALGYFVVKQRSVRQLAENLSFEDARKSEANFFRSTSCWNSLSEELQERIGTPRLTAELSNLLIGLIREMLPGLIEKITSSLEDVYDNLSKMDPELSNNPVGDMMRLVEQFATCLKGKLLGAPGSKLFLRSNRKVLEDFKLQIRETAPFFLPYTAEEERLNRSHGPQAEPDFIAEDFTHFSHLTSYNLEHVRKIIEEEITGELPFNVPFESKASLMLLPVKKWGPLINKCFDKIHPNAQAAALEAIIAFFGRFDQGSLLRTMQTMLSKEINTCAKTTRKSLEDLLQMEYNPMTLNTRYFVSLRGHLLAHYRHVRQYRVREEPVQGENYQSIGTVQASDGGWEPDPNAMAHALAALAELGLRDIRESDLARLYHEDSWEEEITVMAEARAYFQLAYKRIIDTVPQTINHFFVQSLADQLQSVLITGLGIDSRDAVDRCTEYLTENPAITKKRKLLKDKRERLEKAKEALSIIGY